MDLAQGRKQPVSSKCGPLLLAVHYRCLVCQSRVTINRKLMPTDANRRSHSLTGQCALIFGEAIEFVVDVKEPLQETAKFTLALRLQLRQEQVEKMTGSGESLVNSDEVEALRSRGKGWQRELGNGVEYDRVLTGAVKFTL